MRAAARAADRTFNGARVTVDSGKPFGEVVDALKSLVAKNGMMVMAEVNQGQMLSMTGLSVKATLFLVGNPTVGKQLFEQDQAVGLYVPLRVSVYTDANGGTHVEYEPAVVAARPVRQREDRHGREDARREDRGSRQHGDEVDAGAPRERRSLPRATERAMTSMINRTSVARVVLLVLAAAAPNASPAVADGLRIAAPARAAAGNAGGRLCRVVACAWCSRASSPAMARAARRGAAAGAVATLALEAVRYPGFRLGFMPGNLPRLMGVLLLDRFALGPSALSDLAGFTYHFWNGASFGIVFAMLARGRSRLVGADDGLAVGLGFLASPVVLALGVGPFGRDFGWPFAATVMTAHAAFGTALALLLSLALDVSATPAAARTLRSRRSAHSDPLVIGPVVSWPS